MVIDEIEQKLEIESESKQTPSPCLLLILDGFGYSETSEHNAIAAAHMPNWDRLWQQYPHALLSASGTDVGLPSGQMGNSEVGHLNIGAGRIVPQELTRIDQAIDDHSFFKNPIWLNAIKKAVSTHRKIHILGLLSPGGVHSHENQIHAMVKLASQEGAQAIHIHAILDGRDRPPRSALASIDLIEKKFIEYGCDANTSATTSIASITGRYYAMDRDNRWDRIQSAYELLTEGKSNYHYACASDALHAAYERNEGDEFVKPTAIYKEGDEPVTIDDGDVVIFMNYRSDRARELTRAFTQGDDFVGFSRHKQPTLGMFATLTKYAADIDADVAFLPLRPKNTLGESVARAGLKQLRIAETEKYAHVTFFFNGGIEKPFEGEDRILIPSPPVATYDLQPEMSAPIVTDKLVDAIQSKQYSLIVCNFANPDMVGHTGDFKAAVKAIEVIDESLGRIVKALQQVGGCAMITADHGNAERMFNESSKQPHTAHTNNPVPFIYVGSAAATSATSATLTHDRGTLADIAPTILSLMKRPIPEEMTGQILISQEKC